QIQLFTSLSLYLPFFEWIIGGDFNCPLDTHTDRSSPVPLPLLHTAKAILAYMTDYGPIDSWCHLHPTSREYSFYSHAHQTFSRIDFFIGFHKMIACDFLSHFILDHSPICIQLKAPDDSHTSFRWRFNSHLLTRDDFIRELRSVISEFFQFNKSPPSSHDVIWEAFKATIRGKIIAYLVACKKSFQKQMSDLEIELRRAETNHYKTNSTETREQVALRQHELNALSNSRVEKASLHVVVDKAGKLLTWQLRCEKTERFIPSIQVSDTTTSCFPEIINKSFTDYYSSLYSTQYDVRVSKGPMISFLDKLNLPTLSEDAKILLNSSLGLSKILAEPLAIALHSTP
uniref:Endonuclease/exonuclease/phosphatase domain-containing protein n=1 Tax=Latimeria chalumnae TaxID=7897 RepID=H3BDT6_LATCH